MSEKSGVKIPGIGDKLPRFSGQSTIGKINIPADYQDKWLVIISHPADFSPVCTSELVAYARRQHDFEQFNCRLVALSTDDLNTHREWLEAMEEKFENVDFSFPIIADETGEISELLGFLHPDNENMTIRGTIIVDPSGTVRLSDFYPGEVGRSVEETLRVIEALQVADENEVILPAGWPENEEIGGRVMEIKKPGQSDQKHEGQLHGDWWFCHRRLDNQ